MADDIQEILNQRQGWHNPTRLTHKAHYFLRGHAESLCEKWHTWGCEDFCDSDEERVVNCAQCQIRLTRLRWRAREEERGNV